VSWPVLLVAGSGFTAMAPKKTQSAAKRKNAVGCLGSDGACDRPEAEFPHVAEAMGPDDQWHKKPKALDRSEGGGYPLDELPQDQMARAGLSGAGACMPALQEQDPEEVPERAALLNRSPAGITQASSDMHADRRIMGAAAALGGAAGLVLAGPITSAALGVAAAYSTTREDTMGTASRKAGGVYLQVQDKAIDAGIDLLDRAVDEGKLLLEQQKDNRSVPAPVRAGLRYVFEQREQNPALRQEIQQANLAEAKRMRERYPDRVPIICEKSPYSDLPELPKKKFIIPGAMQCGEFKYIMHKQLQQVQGEGFKAEQTIYIFVNGFAPKTSTPISELYDQYKSEDGFMYIKYGAENTLG